MNKSQEKLLNKATTLRDRYDNKMSDLMKGISKRVGHSQTKMDEFNESVLDQINRISK